MAEQYQKWKITGLYGGKKLQEHEYETDKPVSETNINSYNIKQLSFSLSSPVFVQYADLIRSGSFTAIPDTGSQTVHEQNLQKHDAFEIYAVVKGHIDLSLEKEKVTLNTGDCLLMNRNVRSSFNPSYDAILFTIAVTDSFLMEHFSYNGHLTFAEPMLNTFFTVPVSASQKEYCLFHRQPGIDDLTVETMMKTSLQEAAGKAPGYVYMLCGCLQRMMTVLFNPRIYQSEHFRFNPITAEELFDSVKRYLDQHPRLIHRKELSMLFHFNGDYICRIFAERMHESLFTYNHAVCLKEARRLLLDTDLPIQAVAERIGFRSRSHFYTCFKNAYGISPSRIRKQ